MKKKTKTKNNKKNANLPKFAWGGTAFSYESPQETQARLAKQAILNLADYENDPTSKFLDGLGGALAGTGLSMIGAGIGKAGGLSSILGKNGGTSKVGGILDGILGTGSDSSGGGLLGSVNGLFGGGGNGIGGAIGQGIGAGVGLLGNVLGDGQKKKVNSELKQTLNALQSGGSKKTSDLMQEDRNK